MNENEMKLCKAYAKTMGKTFKSIKAEFEQAFLKEAMSHYQKRNANADLLASSLTADEVGSE